MRRQVLVGALLAGALLAAAGCSGGGADAPSATPTPTAEARGRTLEETVATPSLANNILGDPAERDLVVHLPPSYDVSDARYPVVYFLAGAGEPAGRLRGSISLTWDLMVEAGHELIVVELDGRNSIGNNFYTNSPVTGNAEDALVVDVVAHVDATYRTIPEASARGLAGFSMGGSGTVNVGLRHPDVFTALYAASPGLFRPEDGLAGFLHDNGAWASYGAAFAPDPEAPRPHHLPIDPVVPLAEQDPAAVAAWEAGYGALEQKVDAYLALPDRLSAVRIVWGTRDSYRWIPEGSAYFGDLLAERGVPVSTLEFEGTHALDIGFPQDFVDFFGEHLAAG
jgi:pimeloyl-ACP methyl ester carboxylesterase